MGIPLPPANGLASSRGAGDWRLAGLALCLLLAALASPSPCQTAWYEGFESPQISWRPFQGSVQYRVDLHQRIAGEAHNGQGCERLRVSGSGDGYLYFIHEVGHPRIIDELLPTVWVRSDRPGIQILVRVVLPRVRDKSGQPLTTILAGSSYSILGSWQQLRADHLGELLSRQARVLQAQLNRTVDPREAYVDGILLNVYGGTGVTNLWIDDLDVGGYVADSAVPAPQPRPADPSPYAAAPVEPALGTGVEAGPRSRIAISGKILRVDGRELFPRAIQHQGEPLEFLKQRGFNAVWLSRPATTELLAEASRLGLWLICPPPLAPGTGVDAAGGPLIGPGFDRVLAWDMGWGLTGAQLEPVRAWCEAVRAADRTHSRPLICRPESDLYRFSYHVDLVLLGRSPLGSSLELADYGTWVRERPRLVRPDRATWTTVQTQPSAGQRAQWALLARGEPVPNAMANEQLRLLVYTAMSSGSRGLLFESESPLDADDPDARSRAVALELLNLEMDLVEPWAAAGHWVAAVRGSVPETTAAVLRTDRAKLLVPIWSGKGGQFVAGQSAGNGVSFIVPGVPEASRAYEITPGGLKPLERIKTTGGTRITLDEFGLTALVVLTQDPLVISGLTRWTRQMGSRAAELQRQLAIEKLQQVEAIGTRLAATVPDSRTTEWILGARRALRASEELAGTRRYGEAYLQSHRAMRALRLVERTAWQAAVKDLRSPVASPAAVSFRTLPWHLEMQNYLSSVDGGRDLLVGGDFEELGAMLANGWRHFQRSLPGIAGQSELMAGAAHSGQLGLRLGAQPATKEAATLLVESPPVWITTPEIPLETGGLVRISGYVNVPAPITGSVDGLVILDSLGGETLAERIDATSGWVRFSMDRVATPGSRVSVTFAISGFGEAWIDDVRIQVVGQ